MASFVELSLDQGTDFSVNIDLTNDDGSVIDVTNYTFYSSIRKSFYSANATADFIVTVPNSANGNVVLSMNSATSANIKAGRYLYDVKMVSDNNVASRVVEGIITVYPQITK